MNPRQHPSDDLRADQAREHLLRTRTGKPRLLDRIAAARWRGADPRNARAFEDAEALWRALGQIGLNEPRERPASRASRRWAVGLAAASVVLGGLFGLDQLPAGGLEALGADFRTAPGERREIVLADGSRVTLDGATALEVTINAGERRLRLIAGRALFDVRAESQRPFIVQSADQAVRAIGAAFQMTRHDDRLSVEVATGRVLAGSDVKDAVVLGPGQQGGWEGDERKTVKAVDRGSFKAWTRGRLIVTDASLREVADALERASGDRIVILGKARQVRVTAVFDAGDPRGALGRLDATLPIRVTRPLPGWVVIS